MTLQKSPKTFEETQLKTLNETQMNAPESSYIENYFCAKIIRIVIVSHLIIVLIIGIIYALGLISNSKQESSNKSSSKSNEKLPFCKK